jgi:Uma2 family endonuclease
MVQTPSKMLTLEEFLQLPETEPASEFVDGQIIPKPMPQGRHSAIQTELSTAINAALKAKQIARAFVELRCTFGGRSIVPDISVFVWSRILREPDGKIANQFPIAPDWNVEILSPDQSQTKVTKNILHCLKSETQLGWLIDPAEEAVFVYYPDQQPELFEQDAKLPVPAFANELQLTVKNLFDWLL